MTFEVAAPVERVWSVMTDVERWPEWTKSVASVRCGEGGAFRLGSTARIKQPRVPKATWTVTAFAEGRSFEWTSRAPGITSVAGHSVEPAGKGRSRVRLWIRQTGPATRIFGWWMKSLTRRYVRMEAEGLQSRAESA